MESCSNCTERGIGTEHALAGDWLGLAQTHKVKEALPLTSFRSRGIVGAVDILVDVGTFDE